VESWTAVGAKYHCCVMSELRGFFGASLRLVDDEGSRLGATLDGGVMNLDPRAE
jgi:hypothetical protein